MLLRLLPPTRLPEDFGEAEVTAGDDWAHSARLGDRKRLTVVRLTALCVEAIAMARDVAEQVRGMRRKAGVTLGGFDCLVTQASRRVEPIEPQTGASERVLAPDVLDQDSFPGLTLEERLAIPDLVQRLACLPELRQCPRECGSPPGVVVEVRRPGHRDPALNLNARLAPIAFEELEHACRDL